MRSFDDFSRPVEYLSPLDRPFRQLIRRWAEEEVMPYRQQYDEDWQEHRIIEPAFHKLMAELGLQRCLFPDELGGWGLGRSDYAFTLSYALAEELGRADTGMAVASLVTLWPLSLILVEPHVNHRLAAELAPYFCQSERPAFTALAMTEPQGGSDIENVGLLGGKTIRTTARLEGEEWVINGHKLWPTNTGGVAQLFAVPCTTRLGSEDPRDLAIIFVPAETPGVTQGNPYQKAGMAAAKNGDVWFDQVRVPAWYRAHGPGLDAQTFREIIVWGQVGSIAFLTGAMLNLYEILSRFVNEHTYGNRPLKENDAIAGVIGRIAGDIDICRIVGHEAARMGDRRNHRGGLPLYSEELIGRIRNIKDFVSERAIEAFDRAMDVLGVYGCDRAWDVEKHWRDIKIIQLWMGGRQLCQMEAARFFFNCTTL